MSTAGRSRPGGARRRAWHLALAALAAGCAGTTARAPADAPADPPALARGPRRPATATPLYACGPPRAVGRVASDALTETSGLVASPRQADVLFLHNDSGDSARLFAMTPDGRTLAELGLAGVEAFDWEGMGVGPGARVGEAALYVGDFGDNRHERPSVTVLRVPEPAVPPRAAARPQTIPPAWIDRVELVYPAGEHPDAEAVLVDWETGDLVVITKDRMRASRAFVADGPIAAGTTRRTLRDEGLVAMPPDVRSPLVTDASLSPAGDAVLLRTYDDVLLYPRAPGESLPEALARPPRPMPAPAEPQGEAITFLGDGRAYATVSEGEHPPIFVVDLCHAPPSAPFDGRGGGG